MDVFIETSYHAVSIIVFQVDIGLTVENGRQRYEYMFDIKTPQRDYYLGTESMIKIGPDK